MKPFLILADILGGEAAGDLQLTGYIGGTVTLKGANKPNKRGDYLPMGAFPLGKVIVEYKYVGNGIITYTFAPISEKMKSSVPIIVPEKVPARADEIGPKKKRGGFAVSSEAFGAAMVMTITGSAGGWIRSWQKELR